jgi:glycosyltransferase involved in cell wall biosynthesis
MEVFFWLMSVIAGLVWSRPLLDLIRSRNRTWTLESVPEQMDEPFPFISIIVPALNEENTIGKAMQSLMELDYPRYEIIAVNDRSVDATGNILDRLSSGRVKGHPELKVVHINELPEGWLGKNNALNQGSRIARGDYLLFTDADIHFDPTALKRAVHYCHQKKADFLTVFPCIELHWFWETAVSTLFMTLFTLRFRPTHVDRPRSRSYIGVGAFNMIRSDFYRQINGHHPLRMDVIDDVKLGKLVRNNQGRQACLTAGRLIRVRWAVGLRGLIHGLEKNAFASFNFNLMYLFAGVAFMLMVTTWPLIGLVLGSPGIRFLCLIALFEMTFLGAMARPAPESPRGYGLLFPVSGLILIYILLRSAAITFINRGVNWRGTHYPLAELKKGLY